MSESDDEKINDRDGKNNEDKSAADDAARNADIEEKRKKLKKTALIAQVFCGLLAVAMGIVIAVVMCRQ